MNYKEKYEMALEGIQEILSSGEDSIKMSRLKQRLQGIFSELKDSEDEMIRQYLITYFSDIDDCASNLKGKDVVAWLEKQDESSIKWNKNTEGNKPQVNHSVLMKTTHGIAEGEWQGEYWHQYRWAGIVRDSDVLSWVELSDLEKQAEQKSEEVDNLHNYLYGEQKPANSTMQEKAEIDSAFTKMMEKEQKLADKVEPKFHEGEWITNGIDFTFKIHSIEDNMYLRSDDYFIDIETADKKFRLWTIQDAKDGDVLADKTGWTCIFKALNNNTNTFSSYCFMDNDKWFCNTGSECHTLDEAFIKAYRGGEIYPATKEQRDLLFKKMKEAGYEWDAEKKELKKIEQKPVEWEPQTGDTFRKKGTTSPTYHLCNKREDGITFGFVENREVGIAGGEITIFALKDDYELVERPKSIENVVEEELNRALQTKVEQKFTWSEEDETSLTNIIIMLKEGASLHFNKNDITKAVDWLKSLRPHKYVYLYECIKECDGFKVGNIYKSDGEWVYGDNKKCAYDKRFFRSQNHWKPSDKQISALEWQTNNTYQGSWQYEASKKLLEQLKKLREE